MQHHAITAAGRARDRQKPHHGVAMQHHAITAPGRERDRQ